MTTLNLAKEYVNWYRNKYKSSPTDIQIQNFINRHIDAVEGYVRIGYEPYKAIEKVFRNLNQ